MTTTSVNLVKSGEEKLGEAVKDQFVSGAQSIITAATGSGVKTALRWREQCLLATSVKKIVDDLGREYQKPWRYVTSFATSPDSSANPADFMNRLYKHKDDVVGATDEDVLDGNFFNMNSEELNMIGTKIEFYKVLYDSKTENGLTTYTFKKEIPISPITMGRQDWEDSKTGAIVKHIVPGGKKSSTLKRGHHPAADMSLDAMSWIYQGANPSTVRNDIGASMTFGFSSFDQLTKIYQWYDEENIPYEYSALDLLGYGSNSPKMEKNSDNSPTLCPDTYDPSLVELKAVITTVVKKPAGATGIESEKYDQLKKKVEGLKEVLYLTLIDHEFDIAQNGTFTLSLTYRARLEATLAQMRSNVVFSTDLEDYQKLVSTDQLIAAARKEVCNEGAIKDLLSERNKYLRNGWLESFRQFFSIELNSDYMGAVAGSRKQQSTVKKGLTGKKHYDPTDPQDTRQIWRMKYSRSDIVKWLGDQITSPKVKSGPVRAPTNSASQAESTINSISATSLDETSKFSERVFRTGNSGTTSHKVDFILFGDILEIMMHRAMSHQNFLTTKIQLTEDGNVSSSPGIEGAFGESDKIKIISGPMRLHTAPQDGQPQQTIVGSISDIPIAIESFADFWYRNVISMEREVYSVLEFIRDICDQLIGKAFGEGCAFGVKSAFKGRTSVKTGWIQIPGGNDDPLLGHDGDWYDDKTGDLLVESVDKSLTRPEIKAITSSSELWNYIIIYMENTHDMSEYIGDEAGDVRRGIYHLAPQRDTVVSVNFQKTDQPYLRESRFMLLGENPLVHLSNVYSVNVRMEGNNLFYPGQMVYINPISFGNSLGRPVDSSSISNVMGLGGYHIIMSVSHEWSKSSPRWSTTIDALWDNNGNKTTRCEQVPSADECEEKGRSPSGTL